MRLSIDHYYCVGLLTSESLDLLFLIWLQKAEPPPVSKGKCTPELFHSSGVSWLQLN